MKSGLVSKFLETFRQSPAAAFTRVSSHLGTRLENLRMAIRRKTRLERDLLGMALPDNLILSPGGVGTTFLMRHLADYIAINDLGDRDGLKHIPDLPRSVYATHKTLFITGAPEDIYRSISRRDWVRVQAAKLGCVMCQFTFGKVQERLFKAAVLRQIDRFSAIPSENLLVVAFDDIWDRKAEIAAHFGITDPNFLESFPPRRKRHAPTGAENPALS